MGNGDGSESGENRQSIRYILKVKVAKFALNIRQTKELDNSRVFSLSKGKTFTVIGNCQGGRFEEAIQIIWYL